MYADVSYIWKDEKNKTKKIQLKGQITYSMLEEKTIQFKLYC